MTRQDERTDRMLLTGTCLRCDAREIDKKWNKKECIPGRVHLWCLPARVQREPDGVRASLATAVEHDVQAARAHGIDHWPRRPSTIAWLAFGLGCSLFGFLFGYALAKGGLLP